MDLFRIAKKKTILDLSGNGSKISGGRWNQKGTSVLYTSESVSLAAHETLVRIPLSLLPSDLYVLRLNVPDHIIPIHIKVKALPDDWNIYPHIDETADLGTKWAGSKKSLLLSVPSAVIRWENNMIINPAHSDFSLITCSAPEPFAYDSRLSA